MKNRDFETATKIKQELDLTYNKIKAEASTIKKEKPYANKRGSISPSVMFE